MAEYISTFDVFRGRFYKIMYDSELLELDDRDLEIEKVLDDEFVNTPRGYFFDECSPRDAYDYFINKAVEECDIN